MKSDNTCVPLNIMPGIAKTQKHLKINSIMLISAYDILELFQGQDKYLRSLSLAPLIDK